MTPPTTVPMKVMAYGEWRPVGATTENVPPTPDAQGGRYRLDFHEVWAPAAEIPMDETPGDGDWHEVSTIGRLRMQALGFITFRILCRVTQLLDFDGQLAFQYVPASNMSPSEGDWIFLNELGTGPPISLAVVSDTERATDPDQIALLARDDIHIRAVVKRNAGALSVPVRFASVALEFEGGNSIPIPPEQPPDPCEDTGGGGVDVDVSDSFDYADTTALDEVWTTTFEPGSPVTTAFSGSGGISGGGAVQISRAINVHNGYGLKTRIFAVAPGDNITCSAWFRGFDPTSSGVPFGSYMDGPVGVSCVGMAAANGPLIGGGGSAWVSDPTMDTNFRQAVLMFTVPTGINFIRAGVGWLGGSGSMDEDRDLFVDDFVFDGSSILTPPPCDETGPPPEDPGGGSDDVNPTPATGIRALELWEFREPHWDDYVPYQGSVHHQSAATLVSMLNAFRTRGWRFWLVPANDLESKVGGIFSLNKWLSAVQQYDGMQATWTSYSDIIVGIMVIDEPNRTERWGPNGIQWAVLDGVMAKECKRLFPGYPRLIRLDPTDMERSGLRNPQFVTGGWPTWLPRKGDPTTFMTAQRAAQTRIGLKNRQWGLNITPTGSTAPTIAQFRSVGITMAMDVASLGVAVWAQPNDPKLTDNAWQSAAADIINAMVQP